MNSFDERHPKIFISYSHDSVEHKDRILQLSNTLRKEGIDCNIDQYEVSPPEGWPRWMINQIEWADFVLVVCTEQYNLRFRGKESPGKGMGVKWEGAVITQELYDAESKNVKFIPVIFSAGDHAFVPIILRSSSHYRVDTTEGYEDLYRHLTSQPKIQKPDIGKLKPLPYIPRLQDFKSIFALPYSRNPFFTGREEILDGIHKRLNAQDSRSKIKIQAIIGLGGIGKTQIAIEYVYRFREEYKAALCVRCNTSEEIFSDFQNIAEFLSLPIVQTEDQNLIIAAVKHWLTHNTGWLLIFDNADDPSLIQDFIPPSKSGHILITSRSQVLDKLGILEPLEVDKMLPNEAVEFIFKRTGYNNRDNLKEIGAIEQISKELDYLPLALEQAGAYIVRMKCNFENYLLSYNQRGLELLEKYKPMFGKYPKSVITTWIINFELVEKKSPTSSDLIRVIAFLNPDEIPLELFKLGAEELGNNIAKALEKVNEDPLCLDELIEPLTQFSLIRRNLVSRSCNIHHLVQAVLKDSMDHDSRRLWTKRTIKALFLSFPHDLIIKDKGLCEKLLPSVISCRDFIKEFNFYFDEAPSLLNNAGAYLLEAGRYIESEQLFKQALEIAEKIYGSDSPDIICYLNNLGWSQGRQNRFIEAELSLRKSLKLCERKSDDNYPKILNNLAEILREKGEYNEAEFYYKKSIKLLEEDKGDQLILSGVLNNLSELYRKRDEVSARHLVQRALSIKEEILGSDHPGLISVLINLANALSIENNNSEAEKILIRAKKICEDSFGQDHPFYSLILNNLASIYLRWSDYEKAEMLFKESLDIDERIIGHDHSQVATTLSNLASLYEAKGLIDEAIIYGEKALKIRENIHGSEHIDIAVIMSKIVRFYKEKERFDDAISLSKRIISIQNKKIGPLNPTLALSIHNLGALYEYIGNFKNAGFYYGRALNMYEKIYGYDHPALKLTLLNYGGLLVSKLKMPAKRYKLLDRYEAIEEKKYKLIKETSSEK